MNDIDTFLQSYLPISDARAEAKKLMPALINSESNGKNVPSYKGDQVATGPAQLSPAAAKDVGLTEEERHEPVKNAQGGEDYLNILIDKYKDRRTALIAYNWGQNKVDKFGVEKAPKSSKDYAEKILSAKPQEDKKPKITSVDDFLAAYTPKNTAEKVKGIPLPIGGKEFAPEIEKEHTLGEKVVGGLEAGLSTVSAIPATIAAPVQALVNKARGEKGTAEELYTKALESNIYKPHSEAGKEYLGKIAEGVAKSGIVGLGPVGAEVGEIGRAVGAASKQVGMIAKEEGAGLKNLYQQGSPEGTVFPKIPPKTPVDYTKTVASVEQQRLAKARELGITLPVSQTNPTIYNKILEGISGKIKTAQAGSEKNTEIVDDVVRKNLGFKDGVMLGHDTYEAIRDTEGDSYAAIKALPDTWKSTQQWFDAIDNIGDSTTRLMKKVAPLESSSEEVENLKNVLKANSWSPEESVELSKWLRKKQRDFFSENSAKGKALGRAYRQADKALSDMIDANLEATGQKELGTQWRNSREVIATTHALEKATNLAGHVDARQLAAQLKRGVPLKGDIKFVAEVAGTTPKYFQTPQQIGSVLPIDALDALAAISSGIVTGHLTGGLAIAARPMIRAGILSGPYQRTLGKAPKPVVMPTYPKGMDMTPKPVEMPKQSPRSKRIVVEPEETKKASYITGTPYRMDETTGRLVSESRGLPGATPDVIYSADKDLKSAQQKLYTGRKFDLTAEERIALAKYDAEVLQAGPSKNKVVEGGKIPNEQPKTSLTSGIPYTMSGEKLVQETPKGTTLTEPVSDLQNAAKKIQEGRAHELTPEEKISWAKKQIEILRPGAAYKQKKIYPPEEQVKYNKENKKDARRIKPIEDVRLKNPEVQTELKAMAEESGWAEIGGKGIWDEEKGAYKEERTTWLKNNPRSKWYGAGLGSREFIIEAVRKAIAGEPMYAPEKYVVKHMINYIDEEVFPLITEFTPEELDSVGAFEYENAETDALDRALGTTLEKNEADWADMGGKITTDTKNLNTEQIDELLGKKVKK